MGLPGPIKPIDRAPADAAHRLRATLGWPHLIAPGVGAKRAGPARWWRSSRSARAWWNVLGLATYFAYGRRHSLIRGDGRPPVVHGRT